MIVRRAVAADLDAIVAQARLFHAESPHHRALAFSEAKVRQLVDAARGDPDWLVIVARDDDDELVGMAMFFCLPAYFSEDREAQDLAFYVRPENRGGRAALLMIRAVFDWYKATGAATLSIGLNTGINHDQAERFFARVGLHRRGILLGNRT